MEMLQGKDVILYLIQTVKVGNYETYKTNKRNSK